ncbi:hypothetical protein DY000_02046289 [Brassica cretica]|uniref:Uncharacterized protein n=1 Tax=Brassica cretica TaxID=69181 RepID=A0ABQ7F3G7_BRACR|nr:hypothetical protein DY000_02046289 [Brassica cretica]
MSPVIQFSLSRFMSPKEDPFFLDGGSCDEGVCFEDGGSLTVIVFPLGSGGSCSVPVIAVQFRQQQSLGEDDGGYSSTCCFVIKWITRRCGSSSFFFL